MRNDIMPGGTRLSEWGLGRSLTHSHALNGLSVGSGDPVYKHLLEESPTAKGRMSNQSSKRVISILPNLQYLFAICI